MRGVLMGLYQRRGSRFWWMTYTVQEERRFESTKTTSKEIANKIWRHREGELALGLFKIPWAGDRMRFGQLCDEFERSHFAGLTENTIRGHRSYMGNLKAFFGDRKLENITVSLVETYRDERRLRPAKNKPGQTVKGSTVNRELECLKCMLDFAMKRKYIAENPAAQVKHFNELRERPTRRMLTLDEEKRILDAAPVHLRVAIILLSQTGGRTYSEGFSLRWSQVDFEHKVIRLDNNVKTPGSAEPGVFTLLSRRITLCSKSTCDQRSEKPSLYVLPPVWERRMIATRRWTGAASKMRFSSSSVSILRVGLSRSSLKCLTWAAGFSAMYFLFIAKSNMHFKHSSSRLTVAPFTVCPGLFLAACCRRSSR